MEILIILVVCIANILCFYIGARIGQKIIRDEEVTLPNPVTEVREQMQEYRERRENKREQDRIDVILQNVENYDGTGYGQKDVPGKE
jgi:hypothetical protein